MCFREDKSDRTKDFISRFSNEVGLISSQSSKLKNEILEADIICNATSVGMTPDIEQTILQIDFSTIRENPINRVFFDAVYTPLHTKFLTNAADAGYQIADGLDMMIYQGIEAFKIWTGKNVDAETVVKARQYVLDLRE